MTSECKIARLMARVDRLHAQGLRSDLAYSYARQCRDSGKYQYVDAIELAVESLENVQGIPALPIDLQERSF